MLKNMGTKKTGLNKPFRQLVLIKGAGDLATGVGHRLYRAGYRVIMTEIEKPTVIRRPVSFASAVFKNETEVEGIKACKVSGSGQRGHNKKSSPSSFDLAHVHDLINQGLVPVVIDPHLQILEQLSPDVLVEATMAKKNSAVLINCAPAVIALGPGFTAGQDVHAVVETKRGHYLGRVIYRGKALPNDGVPGLIEGHSSDRLIKSPKKGIFIAKKKIGDMVSPGEQVGQVEDTPVKARIKGVLRGLIQDGLDVGEGMKIGDIDPRGQRDHCFTISDKARAIGGGVLEAILALEQG